MAEGGEKQQGMALDDGDQHQTREIRGEIKGIQQIKSLFTLPQIDTGEKTGKGKSCQI